MTGLRDAVDDWAMGAATAALQRAYEETVEAAPSKTNALRGQIATSGPSLGGPFLYVSTISCAAEYAGYTDAGTRPHMIFGRPFLAFYWPKVGRNVVFAHVNHPGTPGTHWFNGGQEGGEPMRSRWEQSLNDVAG